MSFFCGDWLGSLVGDLCSGECLGQYDCGERERERGGRGSKVWLEGGGGRGEES